jgi:hypothetical protein
LISWNVFKTLSRFQKVMGFTPLSRGSTHPTILLKLTVRYGVRDADPEKVASAFRYTIPMFKAGERLGDPPVRYIMRVIVREKLWTILHFHYER